VHLGLPELIVIFVIILLLFGGTRLPKLARSIRESKEELQKGMKSSDKKKDEEKAE
jgi:sec-independent protein translocase protein TatA